MIAWLALLLAGLLEVAWALTLKCSDGLTRFWPTVGMLLAIASSFALLGYSLKQQGRLVPACDSYVSALCFKFGS
jgi:quaternary ammonium compound-resistance protein SugE